MALLDPIVLIAFFGALGLTFLIARMVRKLVDKRRAAKTVRGPDLRSRQVKRAQKRRLQKSDRR
jgi:hypothetical protein